MPYNDILNFFDKHNFTQSLFPHVGYDTMSSLGVVSDGGYGLLAANLNNSDISFNIANASENGAICWVSASDGYVQIDNEIIYYSSVLYSPTTDMFSLSLCSRGRFNTTATNHFSGSFVENRHLAQYENLKSEVLNRIEYIIGKDFSSSADNYDYTFPTSSNITDISAEYQLSNRLKSEYYMGYVGGAGYQLESEVIGEICLGSCSTDDSMGRNYHNEGIQFGTHNTINNCFYGFASLISNAVGSGSGYIYDFNIHLVYYRQSDSPEASSSCSLPVNVYFYLYSGGSAMMDFKFQNTHMMLDESASVLSNDTLHFYSTDIHTSLPVPADGCIKIMFTLSDMSHIHVVGAANTSIDDYTKISIVKTPYVFKNF